MRDLLSQTEYNGSYLVKRIKIFVQIYYERKIRSLYQNSYVNPFTREFSPFLIRKLTGLARKATSKLR